MSKLKTFSRRAFLVGSAAVAGGVAFGYYQAKKSLDNPLETGLAEGAVTFNPWVVVDSEKVTLITPHTDLGQGAYSMQAMLIAEELDIELDQVELSPGFPATAYYNTAFASEVVPFASHDDTMGANAMRTVMGVAIKMMGLMGTGGSSSVPDSFDKLRRAGAVARETLKAAAAKLESVAVADLKTANGAVILPDGRRIEYTKLAKVAADLDPINDVTLKQPSEWRLIGKSIERIDIAAKSTGTLAYSIDLEMPNMVHAAIKLNPRVGGALLSYDAKTAKSMRGVSGVVEVTGGIAVLADNTWRAIKAAEAVECEWGSAPYPSDMQGHWDEIAASFTEERLDKNWRDDGDIETALTDSEPFTAEYKTPYVAHQPLEPLSSIVKVTNGGAEVWAANQLPTILQDKIAKICGCKSEDVRFYQQYAGGSFGHRLEFDYITLAAEIAVQMPDTPVKLTYSREEDFTHDYPRQIGMARGAGTTENGHVSSYDLQVATVSSSRSQQGRMGETLGAGPDKQLAAGAWNMPYAIPDYRMRAYAVPELAPTSSWRSVGASTQGFFADCFLDELIHQASADPMLERLRLMNRKESKQVLEAVAEMSNWGEDLPAGTGRGVAFVDSFGVPVAEVVQVTATDDGIRLDKVWVAADVGRVIDPVNFDNLVKGGVVWGLGHAMNCEITYTDGAADQQNFYDHEAMRFYQCPKIEVRGLELSSKIRGIGEPPVPPAAPALANAIFAATGQRIREMPFNKFIDFV